MCLFGWNLYLLIILLRKFPPLSTDTRDSIHTHAHARSHLMDANGT
jgi:hypothetical protein